MISMFRKLWPNKRGNALAIAAACFPLFIGAAGLATDTIQWTLWKRQLQRAADSAAIAGVYDREAHTGGTSNTSSAVAHDLTLNLHSHFGLMTGFPQVTYPADAGVMTNQVAVTVAIQQPLSFSSIFLSTAPIIRAASTAASIPAGGDACFQALVATPVTGISNSGNTTISAPNCIMYSNSPSVNSASAGGSSDVTVKAIAAVGGIAQSNNWHVQQYIPYSPPLPDPFANVTPDPAAMHCTSSAATKNTDWAAMIAAGTNCFSSMSTQPHDTINVPDNFGPIYINGGGVDFKGTFNCRGCTIVLTNQSTSPTATIGTVTSNAQASNNIDATTSGPFQGLAIYQDRRATGSLDKINGGSGSVINGAVYFPKDDLQINGSGSSTSLCAMFVARTLTFTGNSSIAITNMSNSACAAYGLPGGAAVRMVRLVA